MRMSRSAVLEAPERIAVREFERPVIGPDDGLLRVELAGVCGSDVLHFAGVSSVRHRLPAILGHEIVGRIETVGERAAARWGVGVGERVIVEASFGCGHCEWCLRGSYQMCDEGQGYGGRISAATAPHLWGAYGEFLYLPPRARVQPVSAALSAEAAVVIGAVLANGIRWVRTLGGASVGDTVVVMGPGPQGLAATIAAHAAGAARIVVVGLARDQARMELARRYGATHTLTFDARTAETIAEITDGGLGDVVIDVSGSPSSAVCAVDVVRPLGTLVMAGSLGGTRVEWPWDELVRKEVRAQGVNSHNVVAVRAAVALAESGRYPLEQMVTHRFPLSRAGEAIDLLRSADEEAGVVKVVLDPWA